MTTTAPPPLPPTEHHDPHALPADLTPVRTGTVLVAVFLLAGVLIALFLIGYIPRRNREAQLQAEAREAGNARPIVDVTRPKRSAGTTKLMLPGDARAFQETAIYPRASGYLDSIPVDIGARVQKGDVLAVIAAPDLDADLKQALAAVKQAEANRAKAQDDAQLAKNTYERFVELAAKGDLVTPQQIDEKKSAYIQAKAAASAADASAQAAQAAHERLTSLKGFEQIVAPFAGTITARNYDVGALLSASNSTGREIFRIQDTEILRISVNVPQAYITTVKEGQKAFFSVRNYPGKEFPGHVARSTGAVDATTRTQRFEVDFPNSDHALVPGMYGQVRFEISQSQPPLTVPTSALVYGADGIRVAVVEDGAVRYQKVSVGRDLGTEVEVTSGLQGEELIVANADERISDGSAVQVASVPPPPAPRSAEVPTTKPIAAMAK